jgi:hypothetical protein
MIASFGRDGDRLVLNLLELRPVARSIFWHEAAGQCVTAKVPRLIECANAALDRIEAELETHAPAGRIELGNLPPESARYFACREQLKKVDRLVQARRLKAPRAAKTRIAATSFAPTGSGGAMAGG